MITLEMIDHVMEMTNDSFEAVRSALLRTGGDMEAAIRLLRKEKEEVSETAEDPLHRIERLMRECGLSYTEAKKRLIKAAWVYERAAENGTEEDGDAEKTQTFTEDNGGVGDEAEQRAKERRRKIFEEHTEQLIATLKDLVQRGLATKLIIRKNDQDAVNINLGLGVLGLALKPLLFIGGLGAALFTDYDILVGLHDGRLIDLVDLLIPRERGDASPENTEEAEEKKGTAKEDDEAAAKVSEPDEEADCREIEPDERNPHA